MLIRYPRRVTVNNKRLISKCKKSEKKYASLQKPWHYEELQRGITLKAFALSSSVFIISIKEPVYTKAIMNYKGK